LELENGAVLSTERSLLSRNFPGTSKNNRELKNDLARNRKKLSGLRQNPENRKSNNREFKFPKQTN
jgi:hypothetical protein